MELETLRLQPRRPSWLTPSAAAAAAAAAEALPRAPNGGSPLRLSCAGRASDASPWPAPQRAASPPAAAGEVYLSGSLRAAPSAPPLPAWAADAPTPVAFGRERSGSGGFGPWPDVPGAVGSAAWVAVTRRVETLNARLQAVRRMRDVVSFAPHAVPPPAQAFSVPSAPSEGPPWASAPPLPPLAHSPLAPHLAAATPPPRAAAASPSAPPLPVGTTPSPGKQQWSPGGDVATVTPPTDPECDAAAARAEAAFQAALATAQRVVAKVSAQVDTALTPPRATSPQRRATAA